ncbi:MAG: BatD family protein [Bacteroidota bacterium]
MKTILTTLLLLSGYALFGQNENNFSAQVSTDSVLFGNYFKLTFSLENVNSKDFQAPDFEEFKIVSGPLSSSRTTIINGERSQSTSYTYYLSPNDIGTYYVAPATVDVDGEIWSSEPIEIHVYPNPDGIVQKPEEAKTNSLFDNFWYQEDRPIRKAAPKVKKKKRLTKRI